MFSDIYTFSLLSGTKQNLVQTIPIQNDLVEVAACRAGSASDQFVVMIDVNAELYIVENKFGAERPQDALKAMAVAHDAAEIYKIGSQVTCVQWASETNILVGLHDTFYSIWYCPGEGCADSTIIALTTISVDVR